MAPTLLVASFKISWREVAKRTCKAQLVEQLYYVLRSPRCNGLTETPKVFNFSSPRSTKLRNDNSPEVFQS